MLGTSSGTMDIATCLDLTLDGQMEAKFLALKNLNSKKIKTLMQSLEGKDKEIAKLKVLGKDSRRTQMIQALRDKIRSMELVMDVIKVELGKSEHPVKGKMSIEQVNDFVVEKTVGGPKRFRPLTREELENKVATLEKALLIKAAKAGDNKSTAGSVAGSRAPSVAGGSVASRRSGRGSEAKDAADNADDDDDNDGNNDDAPPAANRGGGGGGGSVTSAGGAAGRERDTLRIVQLLEEVESLKTSLDVAEGAVELQKEEVSRLRERNAELVRGEEESDLATRQYRELRAAYDALLEDLQSCTRKLTESTEENMSLRSEVDVASEAQALEIDALHDQCERLLSQNSALLQRLGEMEVEVEAATAERLKAGSMSASAESSEAVKAQALAAAERRANKLKDQLRASEARVEELKLEAQQVPALTEQLREKNRTIRDLTRRLDDRSGHSQSPDRHKSRTDSLDLGTPGGSVAGENATTAARLAELLEENRTLKQAVAAAALSSPSKASLAQPSHADPLYPQVVKGETALLAALVDYTVGGAGSRARKDVAAAGERLLKLLGALGRGDAADLIDPPRVEALLASVDPSESKA